MLIMKYPRELELNCNTCTEKSIKMHYPEFLDYLTSHYPKELTWTERLYWFYHNLTDYPKCKVCGSRVGFTNFRIGYKKYCCRKCLNSDPIKKEKTKQTCIERYGGHAPASSKLIVQKMQNTSIKKYGVKNIQYLEKTKEKTKQTCIERYGGQGNGSNILLEKYQNTSLKNYGTKNPMSSPDVQNKLKQTFINVYGVDHPSKVKSVRYKIQQSRRKTEMEKHPFIKGYTIDGKWICKCPHEECNKCQEKQYIISAIIHEGRSNEKIEICTNLLPIGKDKTKNTSIELFIQELLDKHNIEYITNDRRLICPKELDIYIPSKKLAIECNGTYSHSSKYKPHNYHINKTKICRENGITLVHIWEDWIRNKPEIVKSIILNKLGLLKNEVIYARKTVLKEVDSKECNDFLEQNHVQGKSQSTIKYGLYYNDELVSVMTFSKPRVNMGGKNHKCQWELVRFCSKLNTRVVGGASKLLNYFIKYYNPDSIVSFSSNDISDGNLYKQLGFESDMKYQSSYWYIEPEFMKRYHRSSFTKREIVKKGYKDIVDSTWTEKEVMEELGFFCIYDSGQLKWILDLKKGC